MGTNAHGVWKCVEPLMMSLILCPAPEQPEWTTRSSVAIFHAAISLRSWKGLLLATN